MDQGCDCVVTGDGPQSNQTIAAAACANRAGLETHLIVPASTGAAAKGLGELLGAVFHEVDSAGDLQKGIRAVAAELRGQRKKPYIILPGAFTTLGVLGYVDTMRALFWERSYTAPPRRLRWCWLGGGSAIRVRCVKWYERRRS